MYISLYFDKNTHSPHQKYFSPSEINILYFMPNILYDEPRYEILCVSFELNVNFDYIGYIQTKMKFV
jgi:hypothetical protein